MELTVDGIRYLPATGESLLEILRKLELDNEKLSARPLAAKIAGEVFNLNYIPEREKDMVAERPSIRAAMVASQGVVRLLRIGDASGREVYTRTAQFVLFLALSQLWPKATATMNCTLGPALYIQVENAPGFSAEKLKAQVHKIVTEDIPLIRRRITTQEADRLFSNQGRTDQTRLLKWRNAPQFDIYSHGDFADYYYSELSSPYPAALGWQPRPMGIWLTRQPDDNQNRKSSTIGCNPACAAFCIYLDIGFGDFVTEAYLVS